MFESDFMEFGDSGLIPQPNGWYVNKDNGNRIAPDGRVYNQSGDLIFDPSEVDEVPTFISKDDDDLYGQTDDKS